MSKKLEVTKYLLGVFQPLLDAEGFTRKTKGSLYRDHEELIDVLTVDFLDKSTHRTWGTTTHSFGLSCGIFLKFAPNPFGGTIPRNRMGDQDPDPTVCAVRSHLIRSVAQPKNVPRNIWAVAPDLSNLDEVARDASQAIRVSALPWFRALDSIPQLLELFRSADERMDGEAPCFGFGRKGSPLRNLYLGFTALVAGQPQIASDALKRAVESGGFAQLSGSSVVDQHIATVLNNLSERMP